MPALATGTGMTVCEAEALLVRNAVIVDASGRWDDQDILIERGEISAIGPDIEYQSNMPVTEFDAAGGIVRPRMDSTIRLFIRTSTTQQRESAEAAYIMPGMPADFTVFDGDQGDSKIRMRIEQGRVSMADAACIQG